MIRMKIDYDYSDEEEEDTEALMYLPVAPEIEEPEEGWPVVSEMVLCFIYF
jgi:COMPASS component SWD1